MHICFLCQYVQLVDTFRTFRLLIQSLQADNIRIHFGDNTSCPVVINHAICTFTIGQEIVTYAQVTFCLRIFFKSGRLLKITIKWIMVGSYCYVDTIQVVYYIRFYHNGRWSFQSNDKINPFGSLSGRKSVFCRTDNLPFFLQFRKECAIHQVLVKVTSHINHFIICFGKVCELFCRFNSIILFQSQVGGDNYIVLKFGYGSRAEFGTGKEISLRADRRPFEQKAITVFTTLVSD